MGVLHYGTSSWSEKGWAGSFYPPGLAPRGYLAHYATEFDTVEADVTYYRVPDAALARGWRARTPEGFVLSAKFPRSIVHAGEGPRPDGSRVLVSPEARADTGAFLAAMGELGPKCGPLLLQFPYFDRRAFETVEPFLERLDAFLAALPEEFRYAVEVRNKDWYAEPLVALLRAHGAALAYVELPYLPHPDRLAARLDLATADFAYVRLIGDRKATDALTTTFDRIVIDRGANLARWAAFLAPVAGRAKETFAYANNHYAGHGPATIRELARLVAAAGEAQANPPR